MKKLITSKNSFLLEAPFEILHSESLEWLEEVEFWKDETAFFYALIVEKTKKNPSVFKTKEAKDMEKQLIHISAGKIDNLKMDVQGHERFLSRIMSDPKIDEQLYRARHKAIAAKIHAFEQEFKEIKRKLFLLSEKAMKMKKPVIA